MFCNPNMLSERSKCVVNSFYMEPVGNKSINDICVDVLTRLGRILQLEEAKAEDQRKKLIKIGKRKMDEAQGTDMPVDATFLDPFVGRPVFEYVISDHTKPIYVNKKNIETRFDVSYNEYINNFPLEDISKFLEVIQDKKTYGLRDIAINVVIYRVGRFSYAAAEPMFTYVDDSIN